MYADRITDSMRRAIDETNRRRSIQTEYNKKHGIVPKTIIKDIRDIIEISKSTGKGSGTEAGSIKMTGRERENLIRELEKKMREASKLLEFEYAAILRDRIIELRGQSDN
jgi:excinuclease ABC subunit B